MAERDKPRLLARGAPRFDPRKPREEQPWTADQASGYTDVAARALVDAGEAVDAETQERFAREGRLRWAEHEMTERREELARKDAQRISSQLRKVLIESARRGVDHVPLTALVDRAIREHRGVLAAARRSP